jgi:antitoxin (DNA-binding transcriptional repressor) of toxin-antitoxin stability system
LLKYQDAGIDHQRREAGMRISVAEAEGQLTELIRLAGDGEEVILTQDGQASARLEPLHGTSQAFSDQEAILAELRKPLKLASEELPLAPEEKAKLIAEIRERVRRRMLPPGPDAARSQDFLYGDDGLPG